MCIFISTKYSIILQVLYDGEKAKEEKVKDLSQIATDICSQVRRG